jgi:hypothetical protein
VAREHLKKNLDSRKARKVIISCCGKTKCSITALRKSKNWKSTNNRSLAITANYLQTATVKGVLQNQQNPTRQPFTSINATIIAPETTAKHGENNGK